MRLFRLYYKERLFLQGIMDTAIENTQTKDMKKCCECACRLLHSLSKPNLKLRAVVMNKIDTSGMLFFEELFRRYAPYKALPPPLRGKSLSAQASDLGLLQRTNAVRVDRATVKRECMMASTRIKMHMKEEIGRECRTVHVLKTKKKQCVDSILKNAMSSGVANITHVWREFHACTKVLVQVALAAIRAVAKVKSVYVMDLHGLTFLFDFPTFKKILDLLASSSVFAINLGEDKGILGSEQFSLLASKILDGSSALRRWFVESNPQRRRTLLVPLGLVSHPLGSKEHPTVFTRARRLDIQRWKDGHRDDYRLAWLRAPESAYVGARKCKTQMQDSLCNWNAACVVTQTVIVNTNLDVLATVANIVD
jgi:hypothetical protein